MRGMFGFIIKDGVLVNSIQIQQEVKQGEKYLVQFMNDPTFSRVVQVEEIQTWLLFQNQQLAANWMTKSQDKTPKLPPGDEPPKDETPPSIEDQLEEAASGGNGAGEGDNPNELCIHGVNLYKEYCDQGQCHEWTAKFAPDLLPEEQQPQTAQGEKDDSSDVS